MAKPIAITLRHDLGAEEAQRRIASGLELLRNRFADRIGAADVQWTGSRADARVTALGQTVSGVIVVSAETVVIEVSLPWLLSGLAEKIQSFATTSGSEALRLPPPR